jgi:hypothetical protein
MTTTLIPSSAPGGVILARPAAAPSSEWAAPARGNVGALPMSRLRRVTEYIQQNLGKGLPLAELAALVSMSPFHFARLFKGSTGLPPHRFVIRQRIAPRLRLPVDAGPLHRADLSECGIPDAKSLHHGVPPRHRRHAPKIPSSTSR